MLFLLNYLGKHDYITNFHIPKKCSSLQVGQKMVFSPSVKMQSCFILLKQVFCNKQWKWGIIHLIET
jgi:hypothetical protein